LFLEFCERIEFTTTDDSLITDTSVAFEFKEGKCPLKVCPYRVTSRFKIARSVSK